MTEPLGPAGGAPPDALTFPCRNCGAKLTYDAGSQGMACPYCGHKEAVQAAPAAAPLAAPGGGGSPDAPGTPAPAGMAPTPAQIREIPIEEGMRMATKGLGAQVQTINCKDCGATVNVGQGERTTSCAFCGSKQVLSQQTNETAIRPESLVPFKIAKEDANGRFGKWIGGLWFRPNDLKKMAKVQEMGGVYVPYWTFDSFVRSNWTAERGWHYYVTEHYTEVVNGQRVNRSRQVQRTRWEPASGWRQDNYDDVLVCAGKGLPANLVEKFSSFDTKQLIPYQPHFLSGWRAESYAVELMPGWGIAQQKIATSQVGKCGRDVGGDTHRSLSVQNAFYNVTFKHVLLPIWIAAYRYNKKVYRFLVNGQTGEVVGDAPWSVWKILALVAAILIVVGGVAWIVNAQQNGSSGSAPAVTATTTATAPAATIAPSATASGAGSASPHGTTAPSGHATAPHPTTTGSGKAPAPPGSTHPGKTH